MQTVDTQVYGSALTSLDNLIVKLLLHFSYYLLDAGRMYTAVAHQLVQGQTAGLATHRIETADNNSLGRVIDDNLNTASGLQGTDITTFATDNATLHIIIVDMEYRYGVLDSRLRGHTLNGLDNNLLGLGIGVQLGLIHDFVNVGLGIGTGFVLQRFHQTVLSFLGAQP